MRLSGIYLRHARRLLPFLYVSVLFGFGANAAFGQLTNEVLNRIEAYNNRLSALSAKITMFKFDNNLGVTDTDYGELKYIPDKENRRDRKPLILVNFTTPKRHFLIREGRYHIYQPGTNQAYVGRTSSVKGQNNESGPLAFLGMSKEELKKNYKHEFLGEATVQNSRKDRTIHLRLTPTITAKYKHAEIWVTKDGLPVQTMVVAVNGDTTRVLLTEHDDQTKINKSIFSLKIPPTANVHEEK